MLLLLQAPKIDVHKMRIAAIIAMVDLLMKSTACSASHAGVATDEPKWWVLQHDSSSCTESVDSNIDMESDLGGT